ncbi:class I SAM-dependent methyltransferase [Photobacterium sp. 53610]|uniref:class I SAM-dependent methyltransferase n=1 Tax=Photobacterium sp. 53610 TaxID=3102789 RepID=UPI002ED9EF08
MTQPTERFSDRADDYQKYRPGYPQEMITALLTITGVEQRSTVTDIGAGTGILTRLLLDRGLQVCAVEPNDAMRQAADELLSGEPGYTSLKAPAEQISLPDHSVDLITAAQSFHWFCNEETRLEFQRIAKPNAYLALIWNRRRLTSPLQQEYDAMLRQFSPDYARVNHMSLSDNGISQFFAAGEMKRLSFDNSQSMDLEALIGRVRSVSYCPQEGSAHYTQLIRSLTQLHQTYQVNGRIAFEYDTQLYLGHIHSQ